MNYKNPSYELYYRYRYLLMLSFFLSVFGIRMATAMLPAAPKPPATFAHFSSTSPGPHTSPSPKLALGHRPATLPSKPWATDQTPPKLALGHRPAPLPS